MSDIHPQYIVNLNETLKDIVRSIDKLNATLKEKNASA